MENLATENMITPKNKKEKWLGLCFMIGGALFIGLTATDWFSKSITSKDFPGLAYNAIIGFGLLVWISADSKINGKNASGLLKFFAVFLPQVTAFVYAFKSRGFKGGLIQSLKILGFTIILLGFVAIPVFVLDGI